jgi:transposase
MNRKCSRCNNKMILDKQRSKRNDKFWICSNCGNVDVVDNTP